jgi:hypothetical protein
MAGDTRRLRQLRGSAATLKTGDGRRRKWPQILRIDNFQQRIGDFREIVIQFLVDAPGQKGK